METYGVYIKIDDDNNIIDVNSDIFQHDLDGWIKIDDGEGVEYFHARGNYFKKPIRTDLGVYRYKFIDDSVHELSEEDIDKIENDILNTLNNTPSPFDIIEAQVTYTAMMTDTLLEV